MATLYQSAETTRKVIIGFLLLAVVILVFDIIGRNPTTPTIDTNALRFYMTPDNKFKTLDPITIPSLDSDRTTSSYAIEGVVGVYPDVAYVYKIDEPREKLLVFENAQEDVDTLGFDPDTFNENENIYTWENDDKSKTLTFDKIKQSWGLTTLYEDNVNAIKNKTITRDEDYYSGRMENLLRSLGFDENGLDDATIDVRFAKLTNGIFEEKTSNLESDYVIIDSYRNLSFADLKPSGELPEVSNKALIPKAVSAQVFNSDPRVGQVRAIVSENFTNYLNELYELNYINWQFSSEVGKYLIISPSEAWTKISQGNGSLVSLLPQNFNYFSEYPTNLKVTRFVADMTKTVVGYWENSEWDGYLHPIYVFYGRANLSDGRLANFTFFIDAIKR